MRRAAYWLCLLAMLGLLAWMNLGPLARIASEAQGLPAFDLRAGGYGETEARAFLGALSDEGREVYLGLQHRLDTIYPALLAIVLIWTYLVLLPRVWALAASILAGLGAVVDWIENARVAGLLIDPAPTAEAIRAASQATVAKTVIVTAALAVLALSLVSAAVKILRR